MPEPLPIHRYCDLFPDIEGEEFDAFVESIKKNGLLVPIDEYKSEVIDGKNRQRACFAAGVTPVYKIWCPPKGCQDVDDDILKFIKSRNMDRRHFSPSQKAAMAAELANIRNGENQHESVKKEGRPIGLPSKTSQKEASEQFGASERSTKRAARVKEKANPEVFKAVKRGEMSLNAAEATITQKETKPNSGKIPDHLQRIFAWRDQFRAFEKLHNPKIAELAVGAAMEFFGEDDCLLDHEKVCNLLTEIHDIIMPWQPEKACHCEGELPSCKKCDGRGWIRKGNS